MRMPTYVRVVLTEACAMACTYCHAEGLKLETAPRSPTPTSSAANSVWTQDLKPLSMGRSGMGGPRRRRRDSTSGEPRRKQALPLEAWKQLLTGCLQLGIRKVKFLGGEPLLSPQLPALIAHVKALKPASDVSLVTSGAVPLERLEACIAAGLDRANLTIHGWTREAFMTHAPHPQLFRDRQRILERLLSWGRPLKLNYVYTGEAVEPDLTGLLTWAASRPLMVGLLDDLNQWQMNDETIRSVLRRLCGPASHQRIEEDPHSLPTQQLSWPSGLRVEVKSSRLGEVAPWDACGRCPRRKICREGIFALRIQPDGSLRLCADRPDLVVPMEAVLGKQLANPNLWHARISDIQAGGFPI